VPQQTTETICPTCGSPVTGHQADEGTGCYLPALLDMADRLLVAEETICRQEKTIASLAARVQAERETAGSLHKHLYGR